MFRDVIGQPSSPQEGITAEGLRQARARDDASLRRWTVPLTLVTAAIMTAGGFMESPGPGSHGASLGVSVALGGFVVAVIGGVRLLAGRPGRRSRRRSSVWCLPVLALLLASSAALQFFQPAAAWVVGLMTGVAVAARVLGGRSSGVLFAGCLIFLAVLAVAWTSPGHPSRRGTPGLAEVLGFVALYGLGLFGRQIHEQAGQAGRLLAELEQARRAELRAAALAERQRLARDMHDVLAHSLSGLTMQLEGARLLAASDPGDARLPAAVDRAHRLAKSGLAEARQAIGMLRDDELPSPARLAALAEAFEAGTGIPCRFGATGEPRELRSAVRLVLYRVTQEALTNIGKHASPAKVEVRLEYLPDEVSLAVQDFAPGPPGRPAGVPDGVAQGGYGLTGMRERAELVGGTLTAGPAGGGFLVLLRVPA